MGYVTNGKSERADTIVGVLWAVGMAVGIVLIDMTPGYQADLVSYLFGSIMVVSQQSLLIMGILDMIIVAAVIIFFKELLAVSYDEEFARVNGIPVTVIRYLLLCLIAFTVVMLIQAVGLILVIALFTIPASIAELFSRNLRSLMVIAAITSMIITTAGLFAAWYTNTPAGAMIIIVASLMFGISFLVRHIMQRDTTANPA